MQLSAIIAVLLLAVVQPQSLDHRVHDFANLLSPAERQALEELSFNVDQKTTAEFGIVTVNSLDGMPVEDYAHEVFEKWGIGKRKANNGVLLLVAPNEHRMWITTGYGVEALLTDSLAGEIRDKHIIPHFKQRDYAGGIKEGANAIAAVLVSDPAAARGDPNSGPVLARTARSRAIFANYAIASLAVVLLIISSIVIWKRLYSTVSFTLVTSIVIALVGIAAYFVW